VAFSAGTNFKGVDVYAAYVFQNGTSYGGISEFGTTEGGNSSSGNYYADQVSRNDPNTSVKGLSGNIFKEALKVDLSYKVELFKGLLSRFTLFAESHDGRRVNFLMTDPAVIGSSATRGNVFGVYRDDQLLYVPNLGTPDPTNPLKFTTNGTTVYFANAAALAQFKSLVNLFGLPQGQIVPKGYGQNPHVDRIDFQYAQEIPSPVHGNSLLFTVDVSNLGNLINKKWGVVKEYSNSRAGTSLVNVTCGDISGAAPTAANPSVCSSYVYSYSTVSAATASKPIVDTVGSLWSVELGLKYKF